MQRSSYVTVVTLSLIGALNAGCGSSSEHQSQDELATGGSGGGKGVKRTSSADSGGSDVNDTGGSGGTGNSGGTGDANSSAPKADGGSNATDDAPTATTRGIGGSSNGTGGSSATSGADSDGTTGNTAAGGEGGAPYSYDCGAFDEDAGWTVRDGYRAVIVADQSDGLNQPVAATFAEGAFGGLLYVVNQGDNVLRSIDVATGAVEVVIDGSAWDTVPRLLTTIVWDEHGVFDGSLYVGDQGSNADNNSRIYRVDRQRQATTFVEGGYGLDDVYGLAFPPPGSDYEPGLYVTGDTDNGARPDWGRIAEDGGIVEFSEVTGAEGIAFDVTGRFGDALWASRPNGGGYAGDDSITPIDRDGMAGPAIATGLRGIHAVTFSPGGDLGTNMYAASWATGQLLQIDPQGQVTELASGLKLTNYDGNILAVSSDGNVLFVADRLAHQLVCIEAI